MASLLIVAAVALLAVVWLRGMRRNRLAWLKKLNLPGRWRCEDGELALDGELGGGHYRLRDGDRDETGSWCLEGNQLVLVPDRSANRARHALRYFAPGKIGLDGPGLPRRVYDRVPDNVVPLRNRGR